MNIFCITLKKLDIFAINPSVSAVGENQLPVAGLEAKNTNKETKPDEGKARPLSGCRLCSIDKETASHQRCTM